MRNLNYLGARKGIFKAHGKALAGWSSYAPKSTAGDLKTADAALNALYKSTMDGIAEDADDPQAAKDLQAALRAAQRAWIKYRDAEAALFKAGFGAKFGAERVDTDVKARLTAQRAEDLKPEEH